MPSNVIVIGFFCQKHEFSFCINHTITPEKKLKMAYNLNKNNFKKILLKINCNAICNNLYKHRAVFRNVFSLTAFGEHQKSFNAKVSSFSNNLALWLIRTTIWTFQKYFRECFSIFYKNCLWINVKKYIARLLIMIMLWPRPDHILF